MEALLAYWLKANVVLALFAAAYYGLLRPLTFFQLNRAYLLFAVGFAACYPLLPVPALLPAAPMAWLPAPAGGASQAAAAAPVATGVAWQQVAGVLYLVGAGALLLRLAGQLLSLALVHRRAQPAVVLGQAVRVVPGEGGPFSFGRTIYLPASALASQATLAVTLRHEQAHVCQAHSLDVLLLQVATALAWANPAAWLLRHCALNNLEYLADQAALRGAGLSTRAYQYLLLHQHTGGVPAPALAFHVDFLTLKNRLLMLNQPLSSSRQLGRYVLAAPLLVLLALGYSGARAQVAPATRYYLNGQLSTREAVDKLPPQSIANMQVLNGLQAQSFAHDQAASSVVVVTSRGQEQAAPVQALNSQLNQSLLPLAKPTVISALPPAALAYITSNYPGYRLVGVGDIAAAGQQPHQYLATIALGRRPTYLVFDETGQRATP